MGKREPALTHVCMWSETGWERITAEQAAILHPGGTVSAHSGLFMCELCGQYVSFAEGQTRHFKHSRAEKSKDCPERIHGANCTISYGAREHDLPIRITGISAYSFCFEIGLIRAPIAALDKNFRVEIKPKEAPERAYIFSKERLNLDGITYLPIGERPFKKYTLKIQNGNDGLHEFWPKEISGIDPEGTVFEAVSGKKLPQDSDVKTKTEYYLLKQGGLYKTSHDGIQIRELSRKRFEGKQWVLYLVSASELNEAAARFYLDFHCRLTEHPISLQPVWPLFGEGRYVIKHNQNEMYMLVTGNAAVVKSFPNSTLRPFRCDEKQSRLYKVTAVGRQQLISAGRTRALQYTYLWKEPLDREEPPPELLVTDLNGTEVSTGETDLLPHKKTLIFKAPFDGEMIVKQNGRITEKRKLPAEKQVELDGLSYHTSVQVMIGLDVVWEIHFRKKNSPLSQNEAEILRQLLANSGPLIPSPHALRNILAGMGQYPQICQWIRKCIKAGTINERSYRKLQDFYLKMNTN